MLCYALTRPIAFAEPSLTAKENAAALKNADPGALDDLKAADKENPEVTAGAGDDYKPSKDSDEGKDLPEGVELEPEDEETV